MLKQSKSLICYKRCWNIRVWKCFLKLRTKLHKSRHHRVLVGAKPLKLNHEAYKSVKFSPNFKMSSPSWTNVKTSPIENVLATVLHNTYVGWEPWLPKPPPPNGELLLKPPPWLWAPRLPKLGVVWLASAPKPLETLELPPNLRKHIFMNNIQDSKTFFYS